MKGIRYTITLGPDAAEIYEAYARGFSIPTTTLLAAVLTKVRGHVDTIMKPNAKAAAPLDALPADKGH